METVACLTTFRDDDSAYSLCNVVNTQLKMLLDAGYKPKLFVTKGYIPGRHAADERVTICELPDQVRQNQVKVDESFQQDVDALVEAFEEHMKDVKVAITHDYIYQPDALKHNVALRVIADNHKDKRFLHWIHSATSPYSLVAERPHFPDKYREVIKDVFPRSYYVFFNDWSRPRIAKNFEVPEEHVKIVHHPTDYVNFAKYEDFTKELVEKHNLLSKDYVCVYPIRLDTGKQVEYVIKIMGALKAANFTVKGMIVDFHSSSDDPKDPKFIYRNQLKETAKQWNVEDEIVFVSEHAPESKVRVPDGVISDLFDVSNIFIMPSSSESYSLITQEAAMKNNLLILNRNFPPFADIFGWEAIHWPMNSGVNVADVSDGDTTVSFFTAEELQDLANKGADINVEIMKREKADFKNLTKLIVKNTTNKQNVTRRNLLRLRNPQYVFTKELEPLFFELQTDKTL